MHPTETSQRFLIAAQAMADAMLIELKQHDPEVADRIAQAVVDGAGLSMAYTFAAEPRLEMLLRVGEHALPVASVPLQHCGKALLL